MTSAARLVGRSAERARLQTAQFDAIDAHPRVVMVQGDPGIGKTALLQEFAAMTRDDRRFAVTSVVCDEHERDVAFGLAGLIVNEWLDAAESVLSVARRLLLWFNDQQYGGATALLLVDDAQWMDLPSAEALRFALRRLRSDRALTFLARRRPEPSDGWAGLLSDDTLSTVIEPRPLNTLDVAELVAQLSDPSLWTIPADQLVRMTGGVPLLVQAMLSSTEGSARANGRVLSADYAVRQMLRGLNGNALLLIQTLSVLAEPSEPTQLAVIADVDDTFAALSAALTTTVVVLGPAGLVDFRHAVLRAAVYEQIPLARQRELHRRASAWSSGTRALAHRVAAAERPDPALVAELVDAADRARDDNQPALAAAHLLRARSVCADPTLRESLLLQALCDRLEGFDLQGALHLEVEARAAPDSPVRSYALGLLARDAGRPEAAVPLLSDAVDRAVVIEDADLAARAAIELARLHASLNDGAHVLAAIDEVAGPTEELAARLATMRAVGEWQSGNIEKAIAILDRLPETKHGTVAEADRFAARGMIRYYYGDLTGSKRDLNDAISLSHVWRPSVMLDRAHVQRFLVHYLTDDWDAAAQDAMTACVLADTGERPWISPLAHAIAAMVPACRGDWDIATDHLEQATAANRRIPSTQGDGMIASAAAIMYAARSDHDAVLSVLAPVREPERLNRLQAVRSYRWVMVYTITALTNLGRLVEAERELLSYRSMVRMWPEAPGPARLGWLAGRLAEARADPVAAAAGYAEDLADPTLGQFWFTLGEILLDSGALERQLAHRREAIDRLSRARALFVKLRAAPFISRCDDELSRVGLSPAPAAQWDLTEREQHVAGLVSRGLTNKEIAADLYLTPKTIEYHLGNVYQKLHITGRRELRRLLTGR